MLCRRHSSQDVATRRDVLEFNFGAADTRLIYGVERTFNKDRNRLLISATGVGDKVADSRHIGSLLKVEGHVMPPSIVFPASRQMARRVKQYSICLPLIFSDKRRQRCVASVSFVSGYHPPSSPAFMKHGDGNEMDTIHMGDLCYSVEM